MACREARARERARHVEERRSATPSHASSAGSARQREHVDGESERAQSAPSSHASSAGSASELQRAMEEEAQRIAATVACDQFSQPFSEVLQTSPKGCERQW